MINILRWVHKVLLCFFGILGSDIIIVGPQDGLPFKPKMDEAPIESHQIYTELEQEEQEEQEE